MSLLRKFLIWHATGQRLGSRRIARYARLYHRHYENFNHVLSENGEAELLRRLTPFGLRMVFDVGANKGEWSIAAAAALPGAEIHAFEADPDVAAEAKARLGKTATVHGFALGDTDGEAELTLFKGGSEASSLMTGIGDRTPVGTKPISIRRGARFCGENGIERIDLLKVDTEGAELSVLNGFQPMIAQGKVEIIQFEYGMTNIYTRVLLKDLYEALPGYEIGKVMPRGVRFAEYRPTAEDFIGINFLAVQRSRSDIISALTLPK